jgi:hypothetical protein
MPDVEPADKRFRLVVREPNGDPCGIQPFEGPR